MSAAGPLLLVVVLFASLAYVITRNAENPELIRIRLVAQQYADAWRDGSLDGVEFDRLSGPNVTDDGADTADAGKVADEVNKITRGLDSGGKLRPVDVQVSQATNAITRDGTDLAKAVLNVTWELQPTGLDQKGQIWSYPVTLQERREGDRWRVVWTPQAVHPDIQYGLVLSKVRGLAPRAAVIGAGDTPLPPHSQPKLAQAVLGAVSPHATDQQAQTAPLRAKPGDTVGVSGLQNEFDERLSGGPRIEVRAVRAQGFNIAPLQTTLFYGPPETPKPLQVTLDARTQGWAESALAGISSPATLVVVKATTGELIAVADANTGQDLGLSAQQPPGSLMGLASGLALMRSGFTLNTRIDCSAPYNLQGQVFRNAQGPLIPGVTLGAAVEGGCTTGLARSATSTTPAQLQQAAYDLGLATPAAGAGPDVPDVSTVGDLLGTPAFHGLTPVDTDPLHHAENLVGEGKVLVSPLSMARATATVSQGLRRAVKLVLDPPAHTQDRLDRLSPQEAASLQDIMRKGVTESGGSAHALAGLPGDTHALSGTAGYGTGQNATRTAWCTGYRGDYAFTVLITDSQATQGAAGAVQAARNFLQVAAM